MDRMSVSEDLFPVVLVFGCILNNFFTTTSFFGILKITKRNVLLTKFWKGGGAIMMEPQDKYREVESALEKFWGEEDLLVGKGKSTPAQIALRFRNAMVLLAAILFLLSFASNRYPILRAVGYLFGAIAYICEIMVLTDCFKVKIPHNELFMPYCFGPLYLIMGVGYLVG